MADALLVVAALLQVLAVVYALVLLNRRRGASGAWLCLLGAMLSMLVWRLVVVTDSRPPAFFNPLIAIWGSSFMVAAMFLFGREVARRERVEAERDELLESERAARSEAERASRSKDDFLATLSHELRTPLAAILGWCTVVRMGRDRPEDVSRAIETIERNAHVQARLIDDLLDVTRMQAGALHLEYVNVALDGPVRAAIQSAKPAAEAKTLALHFRCEDAPPVVRADAGRLQQIASNLLVNAIKFTPSSGVITVTIDTDEGYARLTVEDTGEGITPEFLPQLFARFKQADSTRTRKHGGLGLGLSIVASLVRLHDGDVKAESRGLGLGAKFVVRLPLASATESESAPADQKVALHDLASALEGIRVLVVDDEADVRAAVSRLLEKSGAQVLALQSGETIETAMTSFKPDVLLLDIGMPGEDGYSLIRRIRSLPLKSGSSVPAISLTAHAREEDRQRAIASGFQDHLPKPIDLPRLLECIRKHAQRAGVNVPLYAVK